MDTKNVLIDLKTETAHIRQLRGEYLQELRQHPTQPSEVKHDTLRTDRSLTFYSSILSIIPEDLLTTPLLTRSQHEQAHAFSKELHRRYNLIRPGTLTCTEVMRWAETELTRVLGQVKYAKLLDRCPRAAQINASIKEIQVEQRKYEKAVATTCQSCGVVAAQYRCGQCQRVSYCSLDCQRSDWKGHKGGCLTVD